MNETNALQTESCDIQENTLQNSCENPGTGQLPTPKVRRTRKTVAMANLWSRNETKLKRMKGESYIGFRRVDKKSTNKIKQDVQRSERVMGATCESRQCKKCSTRFCDQITQAEREQIFYDFWKNMSWDTKKMYVCSTVEVTNTKQSTTINKISKRSNSFFYFLKIQEKKRQVCQNMYLNTLGLKKTEMHYWVNNFRNINLPTKGLSPRESQHSVSPRQSQDSVASTSCIEPDTSKKVSAKKTSLEQQRKTLAEFFETLPKLPSHYCRKYTSKLYIDSDIVFLQTDSHSWTHVYKDIYINFCNQKGEKEFSRCTFDRYKKSQKIDIFKPKKDQCEVCTSNKRKTVVSEEFQKHYQLKEAARLEKEEDKEAALKGDCHTICCDLMAVQNVPRLNVSVSYFKLKLSVYNYTVYNMATRDAMNYWIDETEESAMSASVFATCLIDYINELLDEEHKPVIIYSDGCGYQNRNYILSNALLHLSMDRKIKITHKYLEKGHTEMECDSVHATIQRHYKNTEIYLPSQFIVHSIAAREEPFPYRAKALDYTFFKDFTGEDTIIYNNIRPGKRPGDPTVADLRWIEYNENGTILYKLNYEDELQELPIRPKRMKPIPYSSFPPLYVDKPQIPMDKWADLQSLKVYMPGDTHLFYDSIAHEGESRRKTKRQKKQE